MVTKYSDGCMQVLLVHVPHTIRCITRYNLDTMFTTAHWLLSLILLLSQVLTRCSSYIVMEP